jgi:hypothetical protein
MNKKHFFARASLVGAVALWVSLGVALVLPAPPPGFCRWEPAENMCVIDGQCWRHEDGWRCMKDPHNPEAGCECRPSQSPPGGGG